ncbi:MAG: hypothetical protein ACXVCR_19595 [Bdellovibrio sp.]
MHQKLQIDLGITKKNSKNLAKIKKIEAYFRIREAMNRFDYGKILGIDYGGSFGPGSDEYDSEAYEILVFFEQNTYSGKVLTKSALYQKLLQTHKKYFSTNGDSVRCSLITEHIYNELFKLGIFKLSRKSYIFHYYYKKMHTCGWPD